MSRGRTWRNTDSRGRYFLVTLARFSFPASAGPRETVRFPGDPLRIKIPRGRGAGIDTTGYRILQVSGITRSTGTHNGRRDSGSGWASLAMSQLLAEGYWQTRRPSARLSCIVDAETRKNPLAKHTGMAGNSNRRLKDFGWGDRFRHGDEVSAMERR